MREDGWSIYREQLMREHGITLADIESSGDEPREAWTFLVGDVRSVDHCGVVDCPDRADKKLGPAHGLIRCDDSKPEKRKIVELRNKLIARARLA
jgi:hypothetical protein